MESKTDQVESSTNTIKQKSTKKEQETEKKESQDSEKEQKNIGKTVGAKKTVHPIHGVYDRGTTEHFEKREHYAADGKRYCAYGGCVCTQRPMRGYDYCIKHILQDLSAPFKQCDFISKQTKKRCTNPVSLNQEDIRYCNSHKQMLGLLPKDAKFSKKRKKQAKDKTKGKQKSKTRGKKKKDDDSETESDEDNIIRRTYVLSGSDTESDVPSEDEEFVEQTPMEHMLRNSEAVTQEEFLKLRKERIEMLLKLYYRQYKRLRVDLKRKYYEFIRERERSANEALGTKDGTVKIRIKTSTEEDSIAEMPKLPIEPIRLNKQIYLCSKVPKFDSDQRPLCSFGTCTDKRILLSEFCFKHILYDVNQNLYTAGPGGVLDPVLIGSQETQPSNEKEEKEKKKKKRKYVSVEAKKSSQSKKQKMEDFSDPESAEDIKKLQELLSNVKNETMNS